ncbi:MAG: hypothetical protein ACJ71K_15520 [Nitrososphaeraceae archaeon]
MIFGNAEPFNRLEFFIKSKLRPSKFESASRTVNYKGIPYLFDIIVTTVDGNFIIRLQRQGCNFRRLEAA